MADLTRGAVAFVRVPVTPATEAAGLLALQGVRVRLLRAAQVGDAPCWKVDPPLRITLQQPARGRDGRDLQAGHRHWLPAVPAAWLAARPAGWHAGDVAFLQEHYGRLYAREIAAHLGRGVDSVRAKVLELGLKAVTIWTPELDEILALTFPDATATQVGELIGCTEAAVRMRASKLGIKKSPGFMSRCSHERGRARSKYSDDFLEFVGLLYPHHVTEELAVAVGTTADRLYSLAAKYGWKKTEEFVRDTARERSARPDHPMHRFQFPKGHVPLNKGRKGISFPGMERTQFKKGNRPHTWKPLGSYTVDADGYLRKKMTDTGYPPRDWVAVHRLVWIAANGSIPDGHIVRFKPGCKTTKAEDITADKLECITLRENALRNSIHNLPPELREVAQLRGTMNRMINKRERELAEEKA